MTEEGFNRLLDRVEKPARYIGGEYNMQVKDQADLRFALCFPDVYEIGMSHLGSRILYHVLNAMDGVRCERCFAPWTDMEQALREAGEELFTLVDHYRNNSVTDEFICFILHFLFCLIKDSPHLVHYDKFLVELFPGEGHRFSLEFDCDSLVGFIQNPEPYFFFHI